VIRAMLRPTETSGLQRVPPTGFEPVISCVKGRAGGRDRGDRHWPREGLSASIGRLLGHGRPPPTPADGGGDRLRGSKPQCIVSPTDKALRPARITLKPGQLPSPTLPPAIPGFLAILDFLYAELPMDLAAAADAVRRSPWQRERGLPTGLAAKSRCRRYRENLKNRQENPRFWLGKRLRIRVGDQRTWQWVADGGHENLPTGGH
jgi:hypothetical protein